MTRNKPFIDSEPSQAEPRRAKPSQTESSRAEIFFIENKTNLTILNHFSFVFKQNKNIF